MLIDWPKLVIALVLLLVPVALFHGPRVVYRDVSRDWDGYWGRTFRLGLHAVDLVRAMLGAWLIAEALQRAPGTQGVVKYAFFAAQSAVFALAIVLQTLVCKERDAAHAPFAFVSGLVLGFLPPLVAGFALLIAVVISFGANVASGYFPVLAVAVSAIGVLFTGGKNLYALFPISIAAGLPWLLTLLFPRNFVSSFRANPKTTASAPQR